MKTTHATTFSIEKQEKSQRKDEGTRTIRPVLHEKTKTKKNARGNCGCALLITPSERTGITLFAQTATYFKAHTLSVCI